MNLATRLLVDGFNGEYEQAVVVSNDADFVGAMRYVRDGLGLRVTLVNPDSVKASPVGLGRRRDLREAPPEEPPAAQPVPGDAAGRRRRHQETARLVRPPSPSLTPRPIRHPPYPSR